MSGGNSTGRSRSRNLLLVALAVMLLLPWRGGAQVPGGTLLDYTEQERRAILQHGPWPQAWSPDASNRASGKPEAIAFGEKLFFDQRLSAQGAVTCASCHIPERGWTDGRKLA